MTDLERFDQIHKLQRERHVRLSSLNPVSQEDIDFIGFILERAELEWLICEMEIKANEHAEKTKSPISQDTSRRILILKRLASFFTHLQVRFDHQDVEIRDLKMQMEYYQSSFQKIQISDAELIWDNGLKYVSKNIDDF